MFTLLFLRRLRKTNILGLIEIENNQNVLPKVGNTYDLFLGVLVR